VVGGEQAIRKNTLVEAEGEFLFRSLLYNAHFRTQFINRFADQLNTYYEPDRVIDVIEQMQSSLAPKIQDHMTKWNILNASTREWEDNLQILSQFAEERPNYIRQQLIERFDLDGLYSITINQDTEKGYTRVNSIDILTTTPGIIKDTEWTGVYFRGIPIKVTAVPQPGYRFVRWIGTDYMNTSIEVLTENDILLEAVYEPVSH
jgi:hypothetical protein